VEYELHHTQSAGKSFWSEHIKIFFVEAWSYGRKVLLLKLGILSYTHPKFDLTIKYS
jgi:hypothetical protein